MGYTRQPDKIDIEDMLGKVCYSEIKPKMNKFDISNFAAGMYIVKLKYGGYIYNKKLIKY
jgi:hypothetical protein